MAGPLAALTGMNELEMESEGRIDEVMQTCHMVRVVRIQFRILAFFEMIRPYHVGIRISGNSRGKL